MLESSQCNGFPLRAAAPASEPVSSLKFGTVRRFRSLAGADVFPRGLPTRGAKPIEQLPLAEALSRRWEDDRHVVLYTSDRPFRINMGAVGKAHVEVRLLAFDVDNHDGDGAPGWLHAEREKIGALLAAHPGAFVHTTKHGWRAFYALPRPFRIASEADKQAFTLHYARVAAYVFENFGIALDAALIRWNQPIRLPNVVRDGRVFDAEILAGDPAAIGAFELPADVPATTPDLRALVRVVPAWGGVAKQWAPKRELFKVITASKWDDIPLPPHADRLAAAAHWAREQAPRAIQGQHGRATARSVAATLLVGFALEHEDVEELLTGPYNRRRCSPPWEEGEIDDLRGIARSAAHTPIQTPGFMLTRDRTGLEVARATLAAAAATRTLVPLADVPSRIVAAVTAHRALVVRATYGAGKTHTMAGYIARATTGRVLVVVPRHELGRAWVEALAAAGETDVAYHASVVQRRDGEGKRYCANKVALKLYARGGDVRRDVCPSCPRASSCPAYAERPNARARVHVLPREMLAAVGVSPEDLVVFDDAAVDLLQWHRLTVRQLRRLAGADARQLPPVQRAYVSAFVEALLAGPRQGDAIARAALGLPPDAAPGAGEALRQLAASAAEGQRSPYVAPAVLAEGGDELAATLRDTGWLRAVLRFAGACAEGGEVRWSDAVRSVHGESLAAQVLRSHQGRLVVLDAAANVEELRALRSDLHVEQIDVADAGDALRLLLFAERAHRTALRDDAERQASLDLWLRAALAQLDTRRARRPVIISYKELVPALRAHPALAAWLAAHPRRKVRFAHYGNLRGSNRFRRVDAVITLGDPWLNGDDVAGRAAWLELPDEPAYRVALATAELGQAHGRSRSVRRRRRLTHVHIGRLVPDGWGGEGTELAPLGGAPERARGEAARIEFAALVVACGGNRAAAALLGCSSSAVAGWRAGRRSLPLEALEGLREHTSRTKAFASSEEGAGGGVVPVDAGLCNKSSKGRVHPCAGEGEGWSDEAVSAGPAARRDPSENLLSPPLVEVTENSCDEDRPAPPSEGHGRMETTAPVEREDREGDGERSALPACGQGATRREGASEGPSGAGEAARIVAMLEALECEARASPRRPEVGAVPIGRVPLRSCG